MRASCWVSLRCRSLGAPCNVKSHRFTSTDSRYNPQHARVGVAITVFDSTQLHRVLLVQRGKEPAKGKWSLCGGGVELGETLVDAAKVF
jgi:8-oxo-dGTP pyrophosphatase MutT (NUDIX family)